MTITTVTKSASHLLSAEWVPFSGGELEGARPRALCRSCREALNRAALAPAVQWPQQARSPKPLCFACYRADLERARALKAASELDTASEARFQSALPFEPVNRARLRRLQFERRQARVAQNIASPYVDRRRQAQINARHVLARLAEGLRTRSQVQVRGTVSGTKPAAAARALQLPDSWLPFVASR